MAEADRSPASILIDFKLNAEDVVSTLKKLEASIDRILRKLARLGQQATAMSEKWGQKMTEAMGKAERASQKTTRSLQDFLDILIPIQRRLLTVGTSIEGPVRQFDRLAISIKTVATSIALLQTRFAALTSQFLQARTLRLLSGPQQQLLGAPSIRALLSPPIETQQQPPLERFRRLGDIFRPLRESLGELGSSFIAFSRAPVESLSRGLNLVGDSIASIGTGLKRSEVTLLRHMRLVGIDKDLLRALADSGDEAAKSMYELMVRAEAAGMRMKSFGHALVMAFNFLDLVKRMFGWYISAIGLWAMIRTVERLVGEIRDLNDEMMRLNITLGLANEKFRDLRRMKAEVWRQAIRLGVSVKDVTNTLFLLGQAGLRSSEALKALPPVMDMIRIWNTNVEKTVVSLVGVWNIYRKQLQAAGDTSDQFRRIADILSVALSNTTGTMDDLIKGVSYVGNIGQVAGLSLEQLAATLAVLNSRLLLGSRAGTGLRRVLAELTRNTTVLDRVIGVHVDKTRSLGEQWNDIMLSLAAFADRYQGDLTAITQAFEQFGIRGAEPWAALTVAASKYREVLQKINEEQEFTGKHIADVTQSAEAQLNRLREVAARLVSHFVSIRSLIGAVSGGLAMLALSPIVRGLARGFPLSRAFRGVEPALEQIDKFLESAEKNSSKLGESGKKIAAQLTEIRGRYRAVRNQLERVVEGSKEVTSELEKANTRLAKFWVGTKIIIRNIWSMVRGVTLFALKWAAILAMLELAGSLIQDATTKGEGFSNTLKTIEKWLKNVVYLLGGLIKIPMAGLRWIFDFIDIKAEWLNRLISGWEAAIDRLILRIRLLTEGSSGFLRRFQEAQNVVNSTTTTLRTLSVFLRNISQNGDLIQKRAKDVQSSLEEVHKYVRALELLIGEAEAKAGILTPPALVFDYVKAAELIDKINKAASNSGLRVTLRRLYEVLSEAQREELQRVISGLEQFGVTLEAIKTSIVRPELIHFLSQINQYLKESRESSSKIAELLDQIFMPTLENLMISVKRGIPELDDISRDLMTAIDNVRDSAGVLPEELENIRNKLRQLGLASAETKKKLQETGQAVDFGTWEVTFSKIGPKIEEIADLIYDIAYKRTLELTKSTVRAHYEAAKTVERIYADAFEKSAKAAKQAIGSLAQSTLNVAESVRNGIQNFVTSLISQTSDMITKFIAGEKAKLSDFFYSIGKLAIRTIVETMVVWQTRWAMMRAGWIPANWPGTPGTARGMRAGGFEKIGGLLRGFLDIFKAFAGFQKGGYVYMPGIVHPGEFVMRKEAVSNIGLENLAMMNQGLATPNNIVVNINAVDAESFVNLLNKNRSALSSIVGEQILRNSPLRYNVIKRT